MNRRKKAIVALFSALVSGALVYGVYILQLKHVELQETIQIVVPVEFIDAGTRLTDRHLAEKSIVKAAYDSRMARSKEEVIGYEAIIPLAPDEPIHGWKLDKYRLMPGAEQATFRIPKEYIQSIASNIRAGDRVKLYISGEEESRLLYENVTVAAVKSSGNAEITDNTGNHLLHTAANDYEQMYISRRYATGAIDHINLNLSEQQWLELDRLCREDGFMLIIAYTLPTVDEGAKGGSLYANENPLSQ